LVGYVTVSHYLNTGPKRAVDPMRMQPPGQSARAEEAMSMANFTI